MPDDQGRYRLNEQSQYQSPPCPVCGGRTITTWMKAGTLADKGEWYTPGSYRCAKRTCTS